MSVPVTNEAYSQQNNQIFDWAKTATPQQIEAAKQGLPKDSPLLLAIGMGVQYQQQTRAPNPQAPQKTVMEQKLGEFTQASSQGLPQVGQNQMAMQQVAQQDPMFGAGLAVAPENTEQAPQQMAATGGITALARGGEVRHFEEGGPLTVIDPNAQPEDPGMFDPGIFSTYYHKGIAGGLSQAGNTLKKAAKKGYDKASDIGKDILYGADRPEAPLPMDPTAPTFPVPETKVEDTAPKGIMSLKEHLSKGEVNPSSYDADAAVATMLNSQTTPKYSEAPIGKDDVVHTAAEGSSAARNEAAPTAYQTLKDIMEFRGEDADMSEEVDMAREAAANASRDKGLGALVGGIGGMLSAQTPYMGQAIGAGLMSGLSSYQSGAKDEQAANKDLMALQMASKKSKLQGHREAADIILAEKAAIKAAQAATYGKMTQAQYEESLRRGTKDIEHGYNKELEADKQVAALHNNIVMEMIKSKITPYESQKSYIALATSMDPTGMLAASNPEKFKTMLDKAYQNLPGNTGSGLGNIGGGQPLGQPLGSGSVRYSAPAAQ